MTSVESPKREIRVNPKDDFEFAVQMDDARPLLREITIEDSELLDAMDLMESESVDIQHNECCCTLSKYVFYDLDYQQELIDLLLQRKEMVDDDAKMEEKNDSEFKPPVIGHDDIEMLEE